MTPPRPARAPLRLVLLSAGLVALAYASTFAGGPAGRIGPWLMAAGSAGLMTSTMALGALRPQRPARRLAVLMGGVFAVVFGSFAAGLLLHPAAGPAARTVLGLPVPAALVVYGIGLIPLFALPLAYARTFDESRVDPDAIRRRAAEITRGQAIAAGDP